MTARTTAQRQAALRERRKKAGLMEVRGIWAPQWLHSWIKQVAEASIADQNATQTSEQDETYEPSTVAEVAGARR